ncbi:AAA family ATPase [Cohnella boryungensis]|uniref:AAA family ATPase n=1 Tax=Cohnella boryungensis TaxID=768479 RepID=UPI0036711FB3
MTSLRKTREVAVAQLRELETWLESDQLLTSEFVSSFAGTLTSTVRLQDQCIILLLEGRRTEVTITELERLADEKERSFYFAAQAQNARTAVQLFMQLVCHGEEIVDEFKVHQKNAEQLLSLDDELIIEACNIYKTIIQLVCEPEAVDDKSEIYKQITKSVGFVTRYALEKGLLKLPFEEAAASSPAPVDIEASSASNAQVLVRAIPANADNPTGCHPDPNPSELSELPAAASDNATDRKGFEMTEVETVRPSPALSVTPSSVPVELINFKEIKYEVLIRKKLSFSANKFEGDLGQIARNSKLPAFVMGYIYNYGLLAVSHAGYVAAQTRIGGLNGEGARELLIVALTKLFTKGYLAQVTLTEGDKDETCYILSDYGAGAFRKETSRKKVQSLSQLKLVTRPQEEDYVRFEDGEVVFGAYRLCELNRAQARLERELFRELSLLNTSLQPFPYRRLRCNRTDRRFVLFTGMLDVDRPAEEFDKIGQMLELHENFIQLVIVDSAEVGQYWNDKLTIDGREVYFLLDSEDGVILGDKEGVNRLASLFQLEQPDCTVAVPDIPVSSKDESGATTDAIDTVLESSQQLRESEHPASQIDTENEPVTLNETNVISSDQLLLIVETCLSMLAQNRQAEGMMLLHSVIGESDDVDVLRAKISFILGDPLQVEEDWYLLADTPISLPFRESEALDECLNAAMWLRIFFEPDNPNDYRLNNRWRQISEDRSSRALDLYPGIKQLIGYFWSFIDRHHVGIKYCTSTDVRDQLEMKQALDRCRQQIEEMLGTAFHRNVKASINHPKIHQMMTELFGNNGELTRMLRDALEMPLQRLQDICRTFADLSGDPDTRDIEPLESKIEQFIDQHWEGMEFKSTGGKSDALTGALRSRMRSRVREATALLLECYVHRSKAEDYLRTTDITPETINTSHQKALEFIDAAFVQLEQNDQELDTAGVSCLKEVIRQFRDALGDNPVEDQRHFYEPLLLSGEIELNKDGIPFRDEHWLAEHQPHPIEGFRIWERVLRHCEQELPSWEHAADRALREYDMGTYDLISTFKQREWHTEGTIRDTRRRGELQLAKYKEDFMADVESAQNYGQMASNDEMYGYFRLAEAAEKHVKTTGNVGFFKRLLDACREQIRQASVARMDATQKRFEALKHDILKAPDRGIDDSDEQVLQQWPIFGKINRMLENRNMTVAEDYIQLASSGQRDTTIQISSRDMYAHFVEQYHALFNACNAHKGEDLYRTYDPYIRNMLFPNQNNRNTASADKFIGTWFKSQNLKEFMEQLIFHKVDRVERLPGKDDEFRIYPTARDAKLGQYPHPFEAFGTLAVRKGLRVLKMAGVRTPDTVLDEVAQHGAGDGAATIVMLDYAMSLADRRLLAKSIKLRAIPETIVVIDRVMMLFLAGFSQIERASAFLMVALPSSKVQPYIPVGTIPPEMFIGRADELEKIQNPNGPVFVYGGRQLGKTALLRESKNREHDPANGCYAVFVDLKEKNVDTALVKICEELKAERVLQQACGSWEEFRSAMRRRLESPERPIHKLMLLLDESDAFIASCEKNRYRPLEILKELKDLFNHQFKFVLAGLRDVVRFNKQRLGGNSVLAHLGYITIRPLKYLDARDLLLRPLQYLGFRIGEDSEDIISLILAKTNYYPGLIHFYCQKLIEAIADSYRNGNYNERTTPPYVLDEKHIKTLLGQSEFLSEIETKFRITLQLDADNLYDILAKALAYHYYETGVGRGASVQDIIRICKEFEIRKIEAMSEENVAALLEEMMELNIFRYEARDSGKYVFNRYSFFQMLGNHEQVWEHLYRYSELGEG